MKLIVLLIASIIATSCSSVSQPINENMDSQIGWMHGNCLAIKNSNVPPQYDFTLIHLGDEQTTETAKIKQKAFEGEECYPLLDDRVNVNMDAGYTFYLVQSKQPVDLAIGILGAEDISNLNFAFCTTTEGIQFSLSKKNSAVIWKGYYYLGYESEPTCKESQI